MKNLLDLLLDKKIMNLQNTAYFFIIGIAMVVILAFGQDLLIPFVFAILLWFIVREIKALLNRIPLIRERFPNWLKNLITSLVIFMVIGFTSSVITTSIQTLAESYGKYEANVDLLVKKINLSLNIDLLSFMESQVGDFDFGKILSVIFSALAGIVGNTFIVLIYLLFIFLEETNFKAKLKKIIASNNQFNNVSGILERIERSIAKYLGLKTLMSIITGTLSYIILLLIGIDSPAFWAFLIFILNYIPTIGSLIATVFPAVFCLLQFGEFGPGLLVLILVGTVQVLVGNVLEPRLMGNSMNVSALVTIAALSFWGTLWGIVGMVLSIPITVIIIIICSQIPAAQPFAIMLSEKGEIN